jgi:hypothetical protein
MVLIIDFYGLKFFLVIRASYLTAFFPMTPPLPFSTSQLKNSQFCNAQSPQQHHKDWGNTQVKSTFCSQSQES